MTLTLSGMTFRYDEATDRWFPAGKSDAFMRKMGRVIQAAWDAIPAGSPAFPSITMEKAMRIGQIFGVPVEGMDKLAKPEYDPDVVY